MRRVYLALGVGFVALGFIGAFLPVLPTTPFLILAAACFTRSSPRLERWLLNHGRFGPLLRAWRERGVIPWRAKLMALTGSSVGFLLLWIGGDPGPLLAASVGVLIVAVLVYVFSKPCA